MATVIDPTKMNFPGPLGSKRRRMRSGGNVSSQKNNVPPQDVENVSEQKTTQTSNCKGASTIPIFLKSKCHSDRFELYSSICWGWSPSVNDAPFRPQKAAAFLETFTPSHLVSLLYRNLQNDRHLRPRDCIMVSSPLIGYSTGCFVS